MKASRLREQTEEELGQTYQDTLKERFELRAKRAAGRRAEQPLRARTLRRDIARIKTVMRERGFKDHG